MSGTAIVTIGPKQWEVYLATTYEEIIQGLGEVIGIPPQTGMLFDLGYDQVITVTTVPMLFPLDIVFISSDLRVVDIARNVPPGNLVVSDEFARYFLEVNAGEASGVQIGDEVHIHVLVYPAEIGIPPPPPPSMDDIINFGMTAMAMLFAGNIAMSVIESALAPPEKEKELPPGRKLLPPGKLPLLPRTKGRPWLGKKAVELMRATGKEVGTLLVAGFPRGYYKVTPSAIDDSYFIPTEDPARTMREVMDKLDIPADRLRVHPVMPYMPQTARRGSRLEQLEAEALELQRKIRAKYPEHVPEPWPEELKKLQGRLWELGYEITKEARRLEEEGKLEHLPQVNKELTAKWFDRGVEAGKTDGWMTLEDTVRETLENHPEIKDAAELVWTDIELWEETDHFQILYGSEMLEDAGEDLDLYSDLKAEFWEGYLTGRKEIGFDIYKIAAELIRQRERGLEKPEDPLQGKTAKWLWEEGAQFVAIGKERMGFISSVRGGVYPRMLSASIWERDFEAPGGIRLLHEKRLEATDDNLKELVKWVVARVPGRYHWQKWEMAATHAIRAGWHPEIHKRDAGSPILLPKVEGKHLPKTVDKRRRTGDIGKKLRPTRDDVAVRTWSERDRLGIWIVDNRTDETIAEWWDEVAREMFEAGFFKPGVPQHSWEEPSREFVDSVLDYAEDMGWLAKDNPFKFLPRTAAGRGKIRARSITLRRLEGDRQRDDFSSHTLTPLDDKSVWERANSLLRKWSETAPRRGKGYHKVSFIVTYEDGETYQGRFDLRHNTVEYPDLAEHIYRSVAFYAGRYRPPHMA
ncbi:DUF192 domain-containing protein, partial [Dehalococcoidia bacterium]|nr:DUF192 domain-containing protein [Dehalococcoidia bacterium]